MGCYKDNATDRVFKGEPALKKWDVKSCFLEAQKAGNQYFAFENGNCYAQDPNAGQTFAKYGVSSECRGFGGSMRLDVYRLKGIYLH